MYPLLCPGQLLDPVEQLMRPCTVALFTSVYVQVQDLYDFQIVFFLQFVQILQLLALHFHISLSR